jgi:hypothetical protein
MADTDVDKDRSIENWQLSDPLDERRRSTRFRREAESDFALVTDPVDVRGRAEVYDESLGGISLIVDDPIPFEIGMEVGINYAGGPTRAVVRHIAIRDDGRFVVGFQCQ